MKALKQRLSAILAQAKGVRYDRIASRVVGVLGFVAGVAPFAHLIPGQTGALIAGGCAVAGAFLPRATKAAGLLSAAYGQQTPLLKVLPELWATLVAGPSIVAQAKTDAQAAEAAQLQAQADRMKAQSDQETAAQIAQQVEEKVAALKSELLKTDFGKTGQFPVGELSRSVPAELNAALDTAASDTAASDTAASDKDAPASAEKSLALTSVVAVADKAL